MTDRGEFGNPVTETSELVAEIQTGTDVYESPEQATDNHSLLHSMNDQLDVQVKQALAEKIERLSSVELPHSSDYALNQLQGRINQVVESLFGESAGLIVEMPSIKGKKMAGDFDLSANTSSLARQFGISIPEVTERIIAALNSEELIGSIESVGPFINIKLKMPEASSQVLGEVQESREHYGWHRDGEPEVVIVDYSSPNVAKNLTVAHLRSTIIGQSLMQLQEASGNIPFGINHIGDWGTQFGNIIYQYHKERARGGIGFMNQLNQDPPGTLMAIYRKFNEEMEKLPQEEKEKVLDAGRQIFLELENGDASHMELWEKFREWSLMGFGPVYEQLNDIRFDAIQGESFYEDKMESAVAEGLEKGVLVRNEDGSVVFPSQDLIDPATMKVNPQIMLDKQDNPRNEIILKPSGGTVYLTRDLAAIIYRVRELGAQKLLYVIGKEQGAHCIELFNMAHKMGAIALGEAQHVSFGHLNIDGRKMKSRGGKVVLLQELLDGARDAAQTDIDKREHSDELPEGLAEQIGVNAVIFSDLKNDRIKDKGFDPAKDIPEMLATGGAVYIQYSHARLNSLLEKAHAAEKYESLGTVELGEVYEPQKIERDILMYIATFPRVVDTAAKLNAPHRVASYLTEFSQALNSFQASRQLRVVNAESSQARDFRVSLMEASAQVVRNAAKLLHMQLPEKM